MYLMPLARPQDAERIGPPTRSFESGPWFSPDNRAFAYHSTRTGRAEIYVASRTSPAAAVTVSPAGGSNPRWSRDGREVNYMSLDGKVMAAPIRTSPSIVAGAAAPLFGLSAGSWIDYDTAKDGRFLAAVMKQPAAAQPVMAIVNWRPPE